MDSRQVRWLPVIPPLCVSGATGYIGCRMLALYKEAGSESPSSDYRMKRTNTQLLRHSIHLKSREDIERLTLKQNKLIVRRAWGR